MSKQYISPAVRRRIMAEANYRCGYCLTSQRVIGPLLEIDHIIPEAKGGTAEEENLWAACPLCNGAKSDRVEATDPVTAQSVPLFNPRVDEWAEHFAWQDDGARIQGKTPVGRATVDALQMNNPDMIAVRKLWVTVGWHPPSA